MKRQIKQTIVWIITEHCVFLQIDMRVLGKRILIKLQLKNKGNYRLIESIDRLLNQLEEFDYKYDNWAEKFPEADRVHNEEFYFFNIHIHIHRTLLLIELDERDEATVIWAGSHQEYERTFKNNKTTIEKWLKNKNYID